MKFEIPGHIRSKSNARGHWSGRAKVAKLQRQHGKYATLTAFRENRLPDPAKWLERIQPGFADIWLVRIAPRPLDDDNLRDAFKSIRDGIADAFGLADNDPRFSWTYSQSKPSRREGSLVHIEISETH